MDCAVSGILRLWYGQSSRCDVSQRSVQCWSDVPALGRGQRHFGHDLYPSSSQKIRDPGLTATAFIYMI